MQKPVLIGITGESGVGKSTIAEIISLFLGIENATIISTDDLHRWERGNKNWETYTHLNPTANNLELGDEHLRALSAGNHIWRSKYNHSTGHFDPPIKITPKKFIIIEGLHAFYTQFNKDVLDLKIFIDTDEGLRVHWKILRDTEERGYKYNEVLDTIAKRKRDNDHIRDIQIKDADIIIKITSKNKIIHLGDKHEKIDLGISINYINNKHANLFDFIQNYIELSHQFITVSEIIGNDITMVQDSGGNISTKISDKYMLIKASGTALKDVAKYYSLIDYSNFIATSDIENDIIFDQMINDAIISPRYKKPSMETGFHANLKRYVIHLHPIYITLLLCLNNSKNIINEIYSDLDYHHIEYISPGLTLAQRIQSLEGKEIYFLENHGIIVSSDDLNTASRLLSIINDRAKDFILKTTFFEEFDISFTDRKIKNKRYAFPDAAVYHNDIRKKEIMAAHNYINIIGEKISSIRYIDDDEISILQATAAEKYRMSQ
jgi:uridine kinase/ribulose-5-phosphate 4-epimerase/fuculose-1-phosphate aldolase